MPATRTVTRLVPREVIRNGRRDCKVDVLGRSRGAASNLQCCEDDADDAARLACNTLNQCPGLRMLRSSARLAASSRSKV